MLGRSGSLLGHLTQLDLQGGVLGFYLVLINNQTMNQVFIIGTGLNGQYQLEEAGKRRGEEPI